MSAVAACGASLRKLQRWRRGNEAMFRAYAASLADRAMWVGVAKLAVIHVLLAMHITSLLFGESRDVRQ